MTSYVLYVYSTYFDSYGNNLTVFRKDQRLVTETNRLISGRYSGSSAQLAANLSEGSDHLLGSSVRVKSLQILATVLQNFTAHVDKAEAEQRRSVYVWSLLERMRSLGQTVAGSRSRHFENSAVHRFRQRQYQSLLILLPYLAGKHKVSEYMLDMTSTGTYWYWATFHSKNTVLMWGK